MGERTDQRKSQKFLIGPCWLVKEAAPAPAGAFLHSVGGGGVKVHSGGGGKGASE